MIIWYSCEQNVRSSVVAQHAHDVEIMPTDVAVTSVLRHFDVTCRFVVQALYQEIWQLLERKYVSKTMVYTVILEKLLLVILIPWFVRLYKEIIHEL